MGVRGGIRIGRVGEGNESVLDYLFLPTREMIGQRIRFMKARPRRFDGHLFATRAQLSKAILHQFICPRRYAKPSSNQTVFLKPRGADRSESNPKTAP
jgi:hypothetical protein